MISKEKMIGELKRIGIEKGDTLFCRISYKSLGEVEGGPATVIKALRECIGDQGNIVTTAGVQSRFFFNRFFSKKKIFTPDTKNITSGIISVLLSKEPDAYWSKHPIFPCIVAGANAKEITEAHTPECGMYDLLLNVCEKYSAKTLRIGGELFTGIGHISTEKVLKKNKLYQLSVPHKIYYRNENNQLKMLVNAPCQFCVKQYKKLMYENMCETFLYHGQFLDTEASLINMKGQLLREIAFSEHNPERLLCNDPACTTCYRFSFSKHKLDFLKSTSKQLFSKKWKSAFSSIVHFFYLMIFGYKVP